MKSNLFVTISCAIVFLFCIGVACALDADKQQIQVNCSDALPIVKETRVVDAKASGDHSFFDTTSQNYMVRQPSALLYNSGAGDAIELQTTLPNNPPIVKIITPENNSFFDWNSNIDYTIKVSDVEDGESDSLDIASNEVFLEVVYLPDASMAVDYAKKTKANFDSPGFKLLKVADCFNCHAVKTRLQGPAFLEITEKYPHTAATIKMLAGRVIQGSSGVWGIPAMTSHPDMTEEQAGQVVRWIFENAGDPNRSYYSGTRGTFPTKARQENDTHGVYMLTAVYTDHGLKGLMQTSESGLHTIMLHPRQ